MEPAPGRTTADGTTAAQFDIQAQGLDLLKLLSDLVTRASQDLWVSSGLFLTANGILLVALFTGAYPDVWATTTIGIFGLLLSFTWSIVMRSATRREDLWRKKARDLQDKLGISTEFAPWGEDRFYIGVQVTKSKWLKTKVDDRVMMQLVGLAFYALWALVLVAAGGAAHLWKFP